MLDASLMQLMWLASPALPIGGFSYSECLESAVDSAQAATESGATSWLVDQLHLSLARSDFPAAAQGIAAWAADDRTRIARLNACRITQGNNTPQCAGPSSDSSCRIVS